MANQDLIDFISTQRLCSVADEEIKNDLLAKGWQLKDVEEAFAATTQPVIPTNINTAPETGILPPEQEHIIHSWSSGAFVPILYSSFMHLWILLVVEIAIYLSPLLLGIGVHFLPQNIGIGSFFSIFFLYIFGVPIAALLLLIYRVVYGKRLAWKARGWQNFDQFLTVQKRWDIAGRLILIIVLLPLLLIVFTLGLSTLQSKQSSTGVSSTLESPALLDSETIIQP